LLEIFFIEIIKYKNNYNTIKVLVVYLKKIKNQ